MKESVLHYDGVAALPGPARRDDARNCCDRVLARAVLQRWGEEGSEPMVTVRRSRERHHERRRKHEVWHTFDLDGRHDGFGALELLDEDRLPPRGSIPRPRDRDAEIVTYVREGALAHEDSAGRSGVIHAGEFQRRTIRRGMRYGEANASRTYEAQVIRIGLRAGQSGRDAGPEQRRFSAAERRGGLRVVASPDGWHGSLRIQTDVLVYSALLDPGQHVVHELVHGRCAWLHVVQGAVTFGDLVLTTGDGAGVTEDRAVSLTARDHAEVLLVDMG
jgi:quercetin 2,3-dioxygenase